MALFKRHEFSQNSITEGVIWKNLLAFFFPILLGTFFQQLYNTADAVIVGKFVGKEALAAVGGATGTLVNLVVGFFVGLSSGATVILSQFYGGRPRGQSGGTYRRRDVAGGGRAVHGAGHRVFPCDSALDGYPGGCAGPCRGVCAHLLCRHDSFAHL